MPPQVIKTLDEIPETLTLAQLARWQQMGLTTVYDWANSFEGKPGSPFYRVGRGRGRWRVKRDVFLAWRDGHKIAA